MLIRINLELHNGAIRGNSIERVIEVEDEDDIDAIEAVVKEEIDEHMIGWDWAVVK